MFQSILGIVVLSIVIAFGKAETAHAISEVEKIVPTPQQVTYTEQFLPLRQGGVFQAAIVIGRDASQAELEGAQLLQRVIARQSGGSIPVLYDDQPHDGYSVLIAVGTEGSNAVNGAHRIDVPDHTEGYAIERHQVQGRDLYLITGREGIGAYYGATSAAQLIQTSGNSTSIRVVSVRDFPDLSMRIIKDIFNGNTSLREGAFSYSDAMEWMEMLPLLKVNVFSLCYTHLYDSGWENPAADYVQAVQALSNYERDRGIISFMQEINPGYTGGFSGTQAEREQLLDLFKLSLDAGASKMMLAFDDQGSMTATDHRELSNWLYRALAGQENFYMLATPEIYHLGLAAGKPAYLPEFTNGLNPEIGVTWTGDQIFSHHVTPQHVSTWRNYTTNPMRIPFYWHNDPALTDTRLMNNWTTNQYYFADQRVPFQGVDLSGGYIWKEMQKYTSEGVIENIFRQSTPHKIYAISFANWMWNPDAYTNDTNEFLRAKRYWDTIVSNPGFLKTATASSQFDANYAPGKAVDGLTSDESPDNAWATANGQSTANAWWKLDLGTRQSLSGVQIRYREYLDLAYMVPKTVTIQVSDDNVNWQTVVSKSTHVPAENSAYASEGYRYSFQATARYVRLLFEDGGQNFLIELSEVDVLTQSPAPAYPNLTLGKTASASSEFSSSFAASKSVDGLTSHNNVENGWSSTSGANTGAWWKVDLGQPEKIRTVEIVYREYPDSLAYMTPKNVTIQVSNDNTQWTTLLSRSANVPQHGADYGSSIYSYSVEGTGRYLRLLFEDGGQSSLIQLSEVRAFSRTLPEHRRDTANLAHKKQAGASSTYSAAYAPAKANDGSTGRELLENAWASTTQTMNGWWDVDLGNNSEIDYVSVYYREFPFGKAYMVPSSIEFQVSQDGVNWNAVPASAIVPTTNGDYDSKAYHYALQSEGRFLRLRFPNGSQDSLLELVEVEVNTYTPLRDDFYNVVSQDGADPWMYKHTDGYYYYTRTTGGNVTIWRSKTITGIEAGEKKVVWTPPANDPTAPNCSQVWAPEIHFLRGAWYIYYTATTCDGSDNNRRVFALENTNADPFVGSFADKGKVTDASDLWAIDGTAIEANGELYWFWSGWDAPYQDRQNLYIARMSNPYTVSSAKTLISVPTYSWETNYTPKVNEGPQPILRNGKINLVYSASGSWTNDYSLGLITADVNSDLLSASSWTKQAQPIFKSGNGIYGPGHNSFTKSPDGTEDWLVYHAARWSGSGWTRSVRAQPFGWNADHTPNLGQPVPPNVPIHLPSGEPARQRYEAERAALVNGARAIADATSSNGKKVGYIDAANSYAEFNVAVENAGSYVLLIRTGNGTSGSPTATHMMSVNGGASIPVAIVYSGWDQWGIATVEVQFAAGSNTVRFAKGNHYAEIDVMDVIPKQP